jgi:hypothetical protein
MADHSAPCTDDRTPAAELAESHPRLPLPHDAVPRDGSEITAWARRRIIGNNVACVGEERP